MEIILRLLVGAAGIFISSLFLFPIAKAKIEQYESVYIEEYGHPLVSDIEEELACMAMNVYREAAGEPFEGKVAVAQVTMNRVKHREFPDSVCAVVHEKNIFMKKVVCQFSWYCSNRTKARPISPDAYDQSFEVAKKVMLENFELESIKDAIYFHSEKINPRWKYQEVAKIGSHIFYMEPTSG
jgi:N-acetylmuramoyl-L-alanine amidase